MKIALLALLTWSSVIAFAAEYQTNNQTCYGFPRVAGMKVPDGTCIGLVASKKTVNWEFPRKILFAGNGKAFVTAFGGWKTGNGQVWSLSFDGPGNVAITPVALKTDRTHGLRQGPDGRIYFGDATAIYRFDPVNPSQIEAVITGIPDSYKGKPSNHPLSEFVFTGDGSLVLNVGAPTNDCGDEFKTTRSCAQRDEQADLRLYSYDASSNTYSRNFVRIAKGLRNSMGLLVNERTGEIYQAENASDAAGTPDELNVLDMANFNAEAPFDFGWPYCSGMGERYGVYTNYRTFCSSRALKPKLLLPAHAAPLDMRYYSGEMFPELNGKILISYHGHQPSGSRIAVVNTNGYGQPANIAGYFVDGWQADPAGRFPKGAPVGIGEDENGAIFVVDDKNHSLLVVASTGEPTEDGGGSAGEKYTPEKLTTVLSRGELRQWDAMFNSTFVRTDCQRCHQTIVVNGSPRQTLANALNQGWLKLGLALEDQVLWNRLTGARGVRVMPPPGEGLPLVDKNTLGSLKNWLGGI